MSPSERSRPVRRKPPTPAGTTFVDRLPPVCVPGGATLPQHASQSERTARAAKLNHYRTVYKYESPESIPGIAFLRAPVEAIPEETPSWKWRVTFALAKFRRELNFGFSNDLRSVLAALWALMQGLFGIVDRASNLIKGPQSNSNSRAERVARRIAANLAKPVSYGYDFEERSRILKPYRDLFRTLNLPAIADVFMEDDIFCRLRVAGYNPFSLFRVSSSGQLPFAVADADLPAGDSVAAAIAESRMYAQDFSFLKGFSQETKPDKRAAVAHAVFFVPRERAVGDLEVIAIEVNGNVVRPPTRAEEFPGSWTVAKLALNSCDMLHHQLVAHLCNTHLMVEPFVMATMRQLPPTHPLHMLLRPHFEGTAFINENAALELVVEGGAVDRILAGDLLSAMSFVSDYVRAARFNDMMPDTELERRGVCTDSLRMPYRDDALAHWEALVEWTGAYLAVYYRSDDDVRQDTELRAWAAELADPQLGRVFDFGDAGDGRICTLEYLTRAVANVIFKSSVQHAAVNFPQGSTMMYPPATPGFLWGTVPDATTANRDAWSSIITPLENAIEQIEVFCILGGVYYTQIGQYRRGALPKAPAVRDALKVYQQRLQVIEKNIVAREKDEIVKYEFCRPSLVPQSTNV